MKEYDIHNLRGKHDLGALLSLHKNHDNNNNEYKFVSCKSE